MFRGSVVGGWWCLGLVILGCESEAKAPQGAAIDAATSHAMDASTPGADGAAPDAGDSLFENGCPRLRALGDQPLIDDFENGEHIADREARSGQWFYYNDGSTGEQQVERVQDDSSALHVTSTGWGDWGSGFGAPLSAGTTPTRLCPYDVSAYAGVSFKAKGSGRVRLRLNTPERVPVVEGGECTKPGEACYDWPGVWFDLSEAWTSHVFPFCMLKPEGWGGSSPEFDPSQLGAIHFQLQGDVSFWLDELQFTHDDTTEDAGVCQPICPLEAAPSDAVLVPDETWLNLSESLTLNTFEQATERCGSLLRRYISYVPRSLGDASDAPILFALHGSGANAEAFQEDMSRGRLDELAERDGVIVVYGNAAPGMHTEASLPNSGAWRQDYFDDELVDDSDYLLRVLDDLQARGIVTGSNPVYLTGISNGGGMVLKAAKRLPDRFFGIAPLMAFDGFVPTPVPDLRSSKLRKVLFGYSPTDPGVPENYGEVISQLPVQWGAAMGLPQAVLDSPIATALPNPIVEGDTYTGTNPVALATKDSQVTQLDFPDPQSDARLRVLVFEGAGHLWPNPAGETQAWFIERWGFRNQDLDASDAVWDFLLAE
jgi:poly(3-hydroxybutyrate) depolymerase